MDVLIRAKIFCGWFIIITIISFPLWEHNIIYMVPLKAYASFLLQAVANAANFLAFYKQTSLRDYHNEPAYML